MDTLIILGGGFLKILFIYFLERGRKGEERDRNITMRLPLRSPPLGTLPATQACGLTGNRTGAPLVRRLALDPLSPSQDYMCRFYHLG